MKKWISMICALALLLCGCVPAAQTAAPCEVHEYGEPVTVGTGYLEEGEMKYMCKICGEEKVEVLPAKKSISILAVGNSFSVNAMQYLWEILKSAGFEEVVLGNLFIGGCSLEMHWSNLFHNKPAYTYYYNDSGIWKTTNAATAESALQARQWDIVTLQQASHLSGQPASFETLERIQGAIKSYQPDAKMYWYMTWAYHPDTTNGNFGNYAKDQMTMYYAIVDTVKQKIHPNALIDAVIPAGTAIQNLRTYAIGDNLTMPDGFHLNDAGCYTVGLAWYAQITGLSVDRVCYLPKGVLPIAKHLDDIRQAVSDAIAYPMNIMPMAQP